MAAMPEDIRAEAIECVARAFYESWRAAFNSMPRYEGDPPDALPYDDAPDDYGMKRGYRRQATEAVDVLAEVGLLPHHSEIDYAAGMWEGVYRALIHERLVTKWQTRPQFTDAA